MNCLSSWLYGGSCSPENVEERKNESAKVSNKTLCGKFANWINGDHALVKKVILAAALFFTIGFIAGLLVGIPTAIAVMKSLAPKPIYPFPPAIPWPYPIVRLPPLVGPHPIPL